MKKEISRSNKVEPWHNNLKTDGNHDKGNYYHSELAEMFGRSISFIKTRIHREHDADRHIDITNTGDYEVDKKRMTPGFEVRPRKPQIQQYVCETCGCHSTMTSGRRRRWCKICLPNPVSNNRFSKFGLTHPQLLALMAEHLECCAICQKKLTLFKTKGSKNYVNVDHDHASGKIRGILCASCNTRLAAIENVDWREKAMKYLEKYETSSV